MSSDESGDQNPPDQDQLARAFEYYPRLGNVRDYVEQDLGKQITLGSAAAVANLERKYFGVFFKAKTGLNFSEWLERVRITRAQRLLIKERCTIAEVAEQVGYSHLRTFQRAFRRQVGTAPSTYRRISKGS